ncbi:hypothetical protein HK104_006469 [Borealophlyctis nickersoniae]|nr:hypothetical protein HK104_006469 [Borealophlyctis nickersoniae]
MPCILKVRVCQARNLPVMDRATDLTDAFVEVKFADYEVYRTQIIRRTLNPVWNEDFRFEVSDDSDLQNEPLELKVMDYDQITYNDSIGTVYVDLNPLLSWDSTSQINGWIPIFDTLRGIRGDINVQIRLQFFGDINPFKDSSAGVQFFTMTSLPTTFSVVSVLGFVNAVTNEDDPEYHWSDNFRTPRTSNEARTRIMYRLSGQLRRQLGKKALELNGNAVIGFKQYFDIESEQRAITARAIGTAVRLAIPDKAPPIDRGQSWMSLASPMPTPIVDMTQSPLALAPIYTLGGSKLKNIATVQGSEDGSEEDPADSQTNALLLASAAGLKSVEQMPVTLKSFPPGSVLGIGGLVSATSVKIIEDDEREVREAWWTELRDEIKSHAKTLGCPLVIGYSESTSICDDLAVLHCSGTAALVDLSMFNQPAATVHGRSGNDSGDEAKTPKEMRDDASEISLPLPAMTQRPSLSSDIKEGFFEAFAKRRRRRIRVLVCRPRKGKVAELRASVVSESIPFAQYDIHRQLMYKLRIYGLNAAPAAGSDPHRNALIPKVFGLKIQFTVGESLMTAVATGTAVYVRALPTPPAMKVFRNLEVLDEEDQKLLEIQRNITAQSEANRRIIEAVLHAEDDAGEEKKGELDGGKSDSSDSESSSESEDERETTVRQRNVVVQIDDEQDEDLVLLLDPTWPDGFQICNTGLGPKSDPSFQANSTFSIQMFTLIKQSGISLSSHHPNRQLANIFKDLYHDLHHQLSYFSPCIVAGLTYDIQLPKDNEVQISLTAVALGHLRDPEEDSAYAMAKINDSFALGDDLGSIRTAQRGGSSLGGAMLSRQATTMSSISALDRDSLSSVNEDLVFALEEEVESVDRRGTRFSLSRDPSITAPMSPSVGRAVSTPQQLSGDLPRSRDGAGSSYPGSGCGAQSETVHNPVATTTGMDPIPLFVDITPLWYIPCAPVQRFLGRLSLHFVKEASMIYEVGAGLNGMGGFTHTFLVEMQAVCRSHAGALGGNAILGFSVDQIVVSEGIKNQAYALISVSGDVVEVRYEENCSSFVEVLGGVSRGDS